jgi:uncharacterized protein YcbX
MSIEIGRIEAIFRYPVKSMRGEALDAATLGWHGLDGDRRFAFRRLDGRGGFPWLSASKIPDLVRFTPLRRQGEEVPSQILTPEGRELPLFGAALAEEVGRRCGARVEMMELKHGTFDEGAVSVITAATAGEVCRLAGQSVEIRRFRPNVLVRSARAVPFEEDQWVGGELAFGEGDDAPTIAVTMRDVRCAMLNIDPERGTLDAEMMKAVVGANQNCAGIYGTVTRTGRLAVGQAVRVTAKR